jgi:hypothetical protein
MMGFVERSLGRELVRGRVVSRGDDDYARTRRIWNGAVENQPAAIAVCETSADVQAAVRSARQYVLVAAPTCSVWTTRSDRERLWQQHHAIAPAEAALRS